METPVRKLQVLDDLIGDAARCSVVHALAVAGPGHEAPDNELHIGESLGAFGVMKEKAPPVRAGQS
jgi:hypothetical protein